MGGKEEDRPHPGLLPPGEGIVVPASGQSERLTFALVQGFKARIFMIFLKIVLRPLPAFIRVNARPDEDFL